MTRTLGLALTLAAALTAGCKKKSEPAPAAGSGSAAAGSGSAAAGSGSAAAGSGSAAAGSGSAVAPTPPAPPHVADGLATPESVLYDAANDRYLVANINGAPSTSTTTASSPCSAPTARRWPASGSTAPPPTSP
jgi:hypothetical protein